MTEKTLGEIVDSMVRLYVDHRDAIQNQDETDSAFNEYRACVESLNQYERGISVRIGAASSYVPHLLD